MIVDVWVSDLWDDGGWGLRFTRQLHDWELEEVQAFLGRLSAHPLSVETDVFSLLSPSTPPWYCLEFLGAPEN